MSEFASGTKTEEKDPRNFYIDKINKNCHTGISLVCRDVRNNESNIVSVDIVNSRRNTTVDQSIHNDTPFSIVIHFVEMDPISHNLRKAKDVLETLDESIKEVYGKESYISFMQMEIYSEHNSGVDGVNIIGIPKHLMSNKINNEDIKMNNKKKTTENSSKEKISIVEMSELLLKPGDRQILEIDYSVTFNEMVIELFNYISFRGEKFISDMKEGLNKDLLLQQKSQINSMIYSCLSGISTTYGEKRKLSHFYPFVNLCCNQSKGVVISLLEMLGEYYMNGIECEINNLFNDLDKDFVKEYLMNEFEMDWVGENIEFRRPRYWDWDDEFDLESKEGIYTLYRVELEEKIATLVHKLSHGVTIPRTLINQICDRFQETVSDLDNPSLSLIGFINKMKDRIENVLITFKERPFFFKTEYVGTISKYDKSFFQNSAKFSKGLERIVESFMFKLNQLTSNFYGVNRVDDFMWKFSHKELLESILKRSHIQNKSSIKMFVEKIYRDSRKVITSGIENGDSKNSLDTSSKLDDDDIAKEVLKYLRFLNADRIVDDLNEGEIISKSNMDSLEKDISNLLNSSIKRFKKNIIGYEWVDEEFNNKNEKKKVKLPSYFEEMPKTEKGRMKLKENELKRFSSVDNE